MSLIWRSVLVILFAGVLAVSCSIDASKEQESRLVDLEAEFDGLREEVLSLRSQLVTLRTTIECEVGERLGCTGLQASGAPTVAQKVGQLQDCVSRLALRRISSGLVRIDLGYELIKPLSC